MLIYLLAVRLAYVKGRIGQDLYHSCIQELKSLPDKIERLLMGQERIQWFASKYANAKDAFFIGRGADYAISLEGSLKLKEITYIHSEAYAAGELKHGTISLIENRTPVIGVLTQKKLLEKTVSNMKECKARGAYLIAVTDLENELIDGSMDFVIRIPETDEHFFGILAVVPLKLLGYYICVSKGLDVDKPRNLAKSVTVECCRLYGCSHAPKGPRGAQEYSRKQARFHMPRAQPAGRKAKMRKEDFRYGIYSR
jgi:glucosamine--fructose-6-phosphate aminotransferase (isomerizing)